MIILQVVLNILYMLISGVFHFLPFTPPAWFASLVIGLIRWGSFLQFFLPVNTFFSVALTCLGIHLSLMLASALLQLL